MPADQRKRKVKTSRLQGFKTSSPDKRKNRGEIQRQKRLGRKSGRDENQAFGFACVKFVVPLNILVEMLSRRSHRWVSI